MPRKKIFLPQKRLDLHGFNLEEAFKAFDKLLTNSHKTGITKLLVIHGIGSGIMKENVYKWCDSLRYPYILEFAKAPIELGGAGAITITLEKRKEK